MKETSVAETYRRYLIEQNLERRSLFEALGKRYPVKRALYPGGSVHLTPSLYFPEVVYVDKSEAAELFFNDPEAILDFIQKGKSYFNHTQVRFLHLDFTGTLPLRENGFDLLLSLHAGGIARSCWRYLRLGGLLVTNNHHRDADEASQCSHYRLVAVAQERSKSTIIAETDLESYLVPREAEGRPRRYMEGTPMKRLYRKEADYYLFLRTK